jgi:DegV family protein with EDD domain
MSKIVIMGDSCAGLAPAYAAQHNVRIIPLYLIIDGKTYRDGVDITSEEFYERLPKCTVLPTTSQASVGDFVAVYRELVAAGATDIVAVHISSGISGTISSALTAAKEVEGARIEVVDTQCASAAEIAVLNAAVNALERGLDMDGVVAAAKNAVALQRTIFTVDTLEYLYKGGRIGGAAALFGSLLQFKPLLHFVDGKITALERVRTTAKALPRMVEVMGEWLGKTTPLHAIVMQSACMDRANELSALIKRELNIVESEIVPLAPAIGAHAGNGTLGLTCCPASAF